MPRIYRLPVFNLRCAIWHAELPANLEVWNGRRPGRAPDITPVCQLYYPRNAVGRWLHGIRESAYDSFLKTGFQQLRLPKGTDIRAPWVAYQGIAWDKTDLVEVPLGSGRFYAAMMVDDAHAGFTNEYRVAILSQISEGTSITSLACGSAWLSEILPAGVLFAFPSGSMFSTVIEPPGQELLVAAGSGFLGLIFPPGSAHSLGSGSDWSSLIYPPSGQSELGAGSAFVADLGKIVADETFTSGSAYDSVIYPPKVMRESPSGSAYTSSISTPSGPVTPGASCAAAGVITLPFSQVVTMTSTSPGWFTFTAGAGQYHFRMSSITSGSPNFSVNDGACPLPTNRATVNNISTCFAYTPGAGVQVFIKAGQPLMGTDSFTLEVATGPC